MTKKELVINKIEKKLKDNAIRMTAFITFDNKEEECWFEYPLEYQEYVCNERCDAFVIALLPYAMKHNLNIKSNVPISEKLYYQVVSYYIPVLSKYQSHFYSIELSSMVEKGSLNKGHAVGTGISCGVDSFYSVTKHIENVPDSFKLTHLVSMNVGSFGYQGGEFSYNWFQDELVKALKVSKELNLPLITINSNLMEVYQEAHGESGTLRMVGAILGLQKLFSVYYISAGFDIKDFNIESEENDDYDLFNLLSGSNESTIFYSTGLEATRFERTRFISKYPVTYDTLTVCMGGNENCGKCEKCMRTMGALYALDVLDRYNKSFNVDDFKRHKVKNLAKIRYFGIGYMKPLYAEIYDVLRKEEPTMYALYTVLAVLVVLPVEKLKKFVKRILPLQTVERLKKIGK